MRKLFFTLLAVTAFASLVHAQTRFGVKAGANFAHLRVNHADAGDEDQSSEGKTGLHAGFFATLPLSSKFSLQPELLYSVEGGKDKEENAKNTYGYLNLPVMLQYNASGFIVETGPQLGLLMSAKGTVGDLSVDIKEDMKKVAFSWALGAGYRLNNGVGFGVPYNHGLSHLLEGDDKEGKLTSRVFQVSLSFLLGAH